MVQLWDIMIVFGVFEVRMECGNLCCDVNVFFMLCGSEMLGICIEMKNVNLLCFVEGVLRYEIQCQGYLLFEGCKVCQQI